VFGDMMRNWKSPGRGIDRKLLSDKAAPQTLN
jgi:hypothetical protein